MDNYKKGGFNKDRGGFRKEGGFGDRKPFNKPSYGGDRPDFKKKSWDQDGDRPMYQATCSGCGKSCQVPFKPSNGKPVFCNDCFSKQKESGDFVRRDARPSYGDRDQAPRPQAAHQNMDAVMRELQSINLKLNQVISGMAMQSPVVKNQKSEKVAKPVDTKALKALVTKAIAKPKATKKVAAKKTTKKK